MSQRGRGGRGRGNRAPLPREVQVSKKLSWLLRHGAESEGLKLDSAGFINLQDVLDNRNLRSLKVSFAEVREIVRENDKQRFTLLPVDADGVDGDGEGEGVLQTALPSEDAKDYKIRANQGHSLKVESEGLLKPLTADNAPSTCIHGTTHAAWASIVASGGLKPMGRNHIHFASGLPSGFKSIVDLDATSVAAPVVSGMRSSSTVLVFVEVAKAMEAGLKFWRSDNGVILSEGDENGVVSIKFFKRVEDRTGAGVLVENGEVVKEAPKEWGGKGKGKVKG
jgi:2'-phosphotransferase